MLNVLSSAERDRKHKRLGDDDTSAIVHSFTLKQLEVNTASEQNFKHTSYKRSFRIQLLPLHFSTKLDQDSRDTNLATPTAQAWLRTSTCTHCQWWFILSGSCFTVASGSANTAYVPATRQKTTHGQLQSVRSNLTAALTVPLRLSLELVEYSCCLVSLVAWSD